jgi:hypothetical protein
MRERGKTMKLKWNERSREEQAAIEQALLATVREADVKVLTTSGRSARKAA